MKPDEFGKTEFDRQLVMLADLRNIYETGNPAALHECISYCSEKQIPLPNWLSKELQEILSDFFLPPGKSEKIGRHSRMLQEFRDYLTTQVRIEAYRTVRRWQEKITLYEDMPTRCIELWFQGKIDRIPATKANARLIALRGLEGTYFHGGDEAFRKLAIKYDKQVLDDQAQPAGSDVNVPMSFEDFRHSHLLFCKWDTEIDYGLRKVGELFGTTVEPPGHIKTQLDQVRNSQNHLFKGI